MPRHKTDKTQSKQSYPSKPSKQPYLSGKRFVEFQVTGLVGCPYSESAVRLLKEKGFNGQQIREKWVSREESPKYKSEWPTFPIVRVSNSKSKKFIGGYNELKNFIESYESQLQVY